MNDIIIIYDNNECENKLKSDWGFSCFVNFKGKTILFDTGGNSLILLENMEKLRLNPKKINTIVLSHIHGDHTGGLHGILEINSNVTVYALKSFPKDFKEEIKSHGSEIIDVNKSIKICSCVYSTGELGFWVREQGLIIKTKKGLIIITGCAHPGILNIIKKSKEIFDNEIYLVLGGFHLIGKSELEIKNIINNFKRFNVEKVMPCHCSGNKARDLFKEEYKNNFTPCGVGKVIKI